MKALEALDQMGILDKAFVRADQLSGGQQQRVALARTLAQNPQIILADEPVASLDPVTAKQVMDDFQRINRDMHITVLINIHHVELALQYATRVIGIRAGEIVYDGPANQVDQAVLDSIYQGKQEEPASQSHIGHIQSSCKCSQSETAATKTPPQLDITNQYDYIVIRVWSLS